ncbi:type II secretion system F family protein [Streptomyces sclerotialus]|uniref:type II secretion system F family protein n=1 Tax=Streptomyces sclerotialus TaxID=1957 RepID=UPI0004CC68CB
MATAEVVHSLGIVFSLATTLVCTALAVRQSVATTTVRRRANRIFSGPIKAAGEPAHRVRSGRRNAEQRHAGRRNEAVREWAVVAAAAGIGSVLIGGVAGAALGVVGAYVTRGRRRQVRARSAARAAETAVREQLAAAADLLAGCLAAGASPGEAAAAVGESLGGPVGERLRHTAAELRLGSEAAESWGRFAELPGARELGRCLARAGISGAPAVESVARAAADLRSEWGRAATDAARKAGVLVTLPLAVCFLPAFLTIGVAPVLVGLAQGLLPQA